MGILRRAAPRPVQGWWLSVFAEFFIKRPIFASVCAIVFVLGGAVSIPTLPIAQYPELAAPRAESGPPSR